VCVSKREEEVEGRAHMHVLALQRTNKNSMWQTLLQKLLRMNLVKRNVDTNNVPAQCPYTLKILS
jgi:hypothetical protein